MNWLYPAVLCALVIFIATVRLSALAIFGAWLLRRLGL